MTVVRNPVVLFLATGLLSLVGIVLGTAWLSSQAAAQEAINDAQQTTTLLAHSVAQPDLPRGLVSGDAGALDKFDRKILGRISLPDVRRVKIWAEDGTIVYSDKTQLIGDRYPLGGDELAVIRGREEIDAEVSDLTKPENRYERGTPGGLLEVYTRIESPEGTPLLFEVYYSADAIETRSNEVFRQFRPITLAALGGVVLVATALLWGLTRRLRRSAEVRERLLRSAVDASDAERVRIARDLHDGVVQDLAGASFAVSAVARGEVDPAHRHSLEGAADSMRSSLRSLRSLMVEIYPPDLHAVGLEAALDDLLAPAAAQGINAWATVTDVEGASDDAVALVWRVAQESVRNAMRHAGADTIGVEVRGAGSRLHVVVTDDGSGFDPVVPPEGAHFGLRGLTSLVREAGGTLDVRSAPGEGTEVHLDIPRLLDSGDTLTRRRRT